MKDGVDEYENVLKAFQTKRLSRLYRESRLGRKL
jgi:hypothetical protein